MRGLAFAMGLSALALAAPAVAQAPGLERQWVQCTNTNQVYSQDLAIGGCTAIIADFDHSLAIRPDAIDFNNRGTAYQYGRHDYDRAVADYEEALRINPTEAAYLNDACWIRAVAGRDLDVARARCDAAIVGSNNSASYLDSRGLVGLKQGRFQDAWNDYNAAVQQQPQSAHYLYGRGIAALRLGRVSEGQADIAAAIAIASGIAATYAEYGVSPP